ncbi:hypothetical protein ACIQNG_22145 [Streptomyces sp. NPDC091377]|uniref:hypothetical protein n=1 Tax=Streptomyces sp. NPDC091377 TaxID=3365995 RepID=UPI00380A80E3
MVPVEPEPLEVVGKVAGGDVLQAAEQGGGGRDALLDLVDAPVPVAHPRDLDGERRRELRQVEDRLHPPERGRCGSVLFEHGGERCAEAAFEVGDRGHGGHARCELAAHARSEFRCAAGELAQFVVSEVRQERLVAVVLVEVPFFRGGSTCDDVQVP